MGVETVQAQWVEEKVFLLKDHHGFPIVMTQPNGVLGADLLPLSLIGCAAWDVMDMLKKQRQQVTALQVFADSEREEEAPWRFTRICIRYKISGHDIRPEAVERAVALTEGKYCSIYATLRAAIELVSQVEILQEHSSDR
jgi:putative redox protein